MQSIKGLGFKETVMGKHSEEPLESHPTTSYNIPSSYLEVYSGPMTLCVQVEESTQPELISVVLKQVSLSELAHL